MIKLLLIGGGHAMLSSLKRAKSWIAEGVDVTLISASDKLVYSGMLPERLGGIYTEEESTLDLAQLCKEAGVRFVKGLIEHFDVSSKQVKTQDGITYEYDIIALSVGGDTPSFETGFLELSIKPLNRLYSITDWLEETKAQKRTLLVIGAGGAGVELVFNLSARFQHELSSGDLEIHVVEKMYRILPSYPRKASYIASDILKHRGVRIHSGCKLIEPTENGWLLSDATEIQADRVLWASGLIGQDWIRRSAVKTNEKGFILTNRSMQSISHPSVFAAGDCASVRGFEKVSKVGIHALQQGEILSASLDRTIKKRLGERDRKFPIYRPFPLAPLILSTGTPKGLMIFGGLVFYAEWVLRLKHLIDKKWISRYNSSTFSKQSIFKLADARAASV